MPQFAAVRQEHVLKAVAEYDALGRDAFLSKHGFGPHRGYILQVQGRGYDSKAILGVAHHLATGSALSSSSFNGGEGGAARVLRNLGFDVQASPPEGSPRDRTSTQPAVCPVHFIELPASGVCDLCD